MINIYNELEKLKKEVWHINKVVLPRLEKKIENMTGGAELENIQNSIASISTKLTSLEKSLEDNTALTNVLSSKQDVFEALLNTTTSTVNTHGQKLTELESLLNTNTTDISTLNGKLAELETTLSSTTSLISNLSTKLTQLESSLQTTTTTANTNSGRLDEIESQISTLESEVDKISKNNDYLSINFANLQKSFNETNTKVTSVVTNQNTMNSTIETIQSDIASMKTKIESLSAGGGGFGYDLIYDMRSTDETVNWGYTSGMIGGNAIVVDLSPYSYIRLYGFLGNYEAQLFVKIRDRIRTDNTLFNIAANLKTLNFLKVMISETQNSIQVSYYATYVYDATTKTFNLEYGTKKDTFYVYRIEAVK